MEFQKAALEEVVRHLASGKNGLSRAEARKRRERYGPNEIRSDHEISPLRIFASQFNSFIVYILVAAVVVSFFLHEIIDSIVIAVILVLNAILGFVQEYRAEKAVESLRKMAALQATVVRDGRKERIDSGELVPGDVIVFEAGDQIPADARILESYHLEVMESSLTGESHAVAKDAAFLANTGTLGDMRNMVFGGTQVTNGSGRAVVVRTGMETAMGKIAESIESVRDDQTPLQKQLDGLGRRLGLLTLILCAFMVAFGVLKGGGFLEMVMVGVSLAVAAVPEGLPIVVTIALALGVRRMAGQNALVKRLPSVETLGCTTVICTDKTGTLTRNEMTVTKLYVHERVVEVTGTGTETQGEFLPGGQDAGTGTGASDVELLLRIGALNNDAELSAAGAVVGDPTEGCLIASAAKAGLDLQTLQGAFPRIHEIPFDSTRKRKSTLHRAGPGRVMYTKGAPDVMLDLCTKIDLGGRVVPLTEAARRSIAETNRQFAAQALRVLAFAYRPLSPDETVEQAEEADLIFVGLQGMIDPPRGEVKGAIDRCRRAGIRAVMITGDYALTASAIARQLGIEGEARTGEEIAEMDAAQLRETVKTVSIFSRVNPEHKIRIVRALRGTGEVVAMTGDGINDAPALKEADIGIAMGITGTDVTKETADMVLLDDRYTSIVHAVEQGRGIYENIKKFVNYLLSSNLGEVLILFAALAIGFQGEGGGIAMPLLATQILWLNLVTDGLPAVAIGVDPLRSGIMDLPPRRPDQRMITRDMAWNIVVISVMMAVGVLFLFGRFLPEGEAIARTVSFTAIVMLEMVRVAMIRSQYGLSFFSNRYLVGAIVLSVLLQVLVVYLPVMNVIFKTTPLAVHHWAGIGSVMAVMYVAGTAIAKRWLR